MPMCNVPVTRSVPLLPASVFAGVVVIMIFWFVVVFAVVGLRLDHVAGLHVLDGLAAFWRADRRPNCENVTVISQGWPTVPLA